jgi:hypothetical protein
MGYSGNKLSNGGYAFRLNQSLLGPFLFFESILTGIYQ